MPGVPRYLEIKFGDNQFDNKVALSLKLNPEDIEKDLRGLTVLVRISKAHYRFHEFTVDHIGRNHETGEIHTLTLIKRGDDKTNGVETNGSKN